MDWKVFYKKRIEGQIKKMPKREQEKFSILVEDLELKGPIRPEWPHYSLLHKDENRKKDKTEYHCHLSKSWVACWRVENNAIEIEVYYAGSRENAPY